MTMQTGIWNGVKSRFTDAYRRMDSDIQRSFGPKHQLLRENVGSILQDGRALSKANLATSKGAEKDIYKETLKAGSFTTGVFGALNENRGRALMGTGAAIGATIGLTSMDKDNSGLLNSTMVGASTAFGAGLFGTMAYQMAKGRIREGMAGRVSDLMSQW